MRGSLSQNCSCHFKKYEEIAIFYYFFLMCGTKMSILCCKFTHLEKCDCVFCTSMISQNSHSQFIFTKLFFVCLNAAKAYCSESQSWSYCHQQRLHRQILCRLCGKFKFFVLVFKVWHCLADCYPWLSLLLPGSSQISLHVSLLISSGHITASLNIPFRLSLLHHEHPFTFFSLPMRRKVEHCCIAIRA